MLKIRYILLNIIIIRVRFYKFYFINFRQLQAPVRVQLLGSEIYRCMAVVFIVIDARYILSYRIIKYFDQSRNVQTLQLRFLWLLNYLNIK